MPIKYQMLGGGGGLTELTIKTTKPNTTVTITKENFKQVFSSDESCSVVCKLADGTYLIKSETPDGKIAQKEITISKQAQADLRVSDKIKNLPKGAKLKFSSGKKFVLQEINALGHDPNTVTFVSEFIIEDSSASNYRYTDSEAYVNVLPKYYNELNGAEKNAVVRRKYSYYYSWRGGDGGRYNEDKTGSAESYFYIMSQSELNLEGYNTGSNLGFTNDASRIKKYENGNTGTYWIRDGSDDTWLSRNYVMIVTKYGKTDSLVVSYPGVSSGVVPACDIKGDTNVLLDTDGYWVVA